MEIYKTKEDLLNTLNVSSATINNWIRTGVIPAKTSRENYSVEEFNKIIELLSSSESLRLKKRANRTMTDSRLRCYHQMVDYNSKSALTEALKIHNANNLSAEESIFALSVKQLNSSRLLNKGWLESPKTLIEKFLNSWGSEKKLNTGRILSLYDNIPVINPEDDFIGAFYQSILSVSEKSISGSYYTPGHLLEDIQIPHDKTVFDPCCGSGSILMKILDRKHNPDRIFASDIDELSLKICRINLTTFFRDPDITPHIENKDILFDSDTSVDSTGDSDKFDFIVTNPPWGSRLSKHDKKNLLKKYPLLSTTESFSIALFNSINRLAWDGTAIFFLPYSFLNVSAHKKIRKYITDLQPELSITVLGNPFPGVMSESIRIELKKNSNSHIKILSKERTLQSRLNYKSITEPDYIFNASADRHDLNIIKKIYSREHILLKNNAIFAMGIVTGDNRKHVLNEPTESSEPVFRGKDIEPFRFSDAECFMELSPASYQQTAPVEYYRSNKIVYRFISDKIVCAADMKGRLLLNSANFFIPQTGYPIESIVTLFNSSLYTYLYRKIYYSKKVLRSHIESFPLPVLNKAQHKKLAALHSLFAEGAGSYEELNSLVYSLFSISGRDKLTIEKNRDS